MGCESHRFLNLSHIAIKPPYSVISAFRDCASSGFFYLTVKTADFIICTSGGGKKTVTLCFATLLSFAFCLLNRSAQQNAEETVESDVHEVGHKKEELQSCSSDGKGGALSLSIRWNVSHPVPTCFLMRNQSVFEKTAQYVTRGFLLCLCGRVWIPAQQVFRDAFSYP